MQDQICTLVLNIDIPLLGNSFSFGTWYLKPIMPSCHTFMEKKLLAFRNIPNVFSLMLTYASFSATSLPLLKLISTDLLQVISNVPSDLD